MDARGVPGVAGGSPLSQAAGTGGESSEAPPMPHHDGGDRDRQIGASDPYGDAMNPDPGTADPYGDAMKRAGRLLGHRPYTAAALRDKLEAAGFEGSTLDRVIDRLTETGVVDDLDFARRWLERRAAGSRSSRLLAEELAAKGVDEVTIRTALDEMDADEVARATSVAAAYSRKVASDTLARQAARILRHLSSKGFEHEVAEAATRAVLPPQGWD